LRTIPWIVCLAGLAVPSPGLAQAPPTSAEPPAAKYRIGKDRLMFGQIEDNAPFRTEERNPAEAEAYAAVLLHARQFPAAELEEHARRDVTFKDLFRNADEFRLELVYFEGRLKQLRRTTPTKALAAAGVTDQYEGWLFPRGESNPVCVLVTDLPPGLEAQADVRTEMDRWVAFAGYAFKVFHYESRKVHPKDPTRNLVMAAPVLMGRSITPLPEPAGGGDSGWLTTFLPAAVAGTGGLALAIVGLTWYYRRGDRAVRAAVEARRDRNPFTE
jgi:hypothetical protein